MPQPRATQLTLYRSRILKQNIQPGPAFPGSYYFPYVPYTVKRKRRSWVELVNYVTGLLAMSCRVFAPTSAARVTSGTRIEKPAE